MTREHVIPSFIYNFQKRNGEKQIGWNEIIGKMVGGEAKIRDVCSECNNGSLGSLDRYGKELLSQSGVLVKNYLKQSLQLHYDYDLLLRWVLKISFNSSRIDGAHRHLFEPFIPFILHGRPRPERNQIGLVAYLASPIETKTVSEETRPYIYLAEDSEFFNPFFMRISYGHAPGLKNLTLRIVSFGPLYFLMPIFDQGVLHGHAASSIRRLVKISKGAVKLCPSKYFSQLKAGEYSWLQLYEHQVLRSKTLESY